jgi:pimeloyl-ACP methyl ester carboxylesterase
MPFATAPDGTRLFYDTVGQGTPLVLVSGQAFDHRMWDGVRDDFASRHQVIVCDHRGIGQSGKPEQPDAYSTRIFAQDIVAILDALAIERAHIYGFSMGGRIAQWLSIAHAGRVRSVVLGATTPGNAHGVRRPPEADAVLGSGKQSALQDLLVSPSWREQHPEWVAMMAERARHPMPLFAQRLHFMASEMHETWAELPRITAPTLVIHGTADQINVSANAPLLAQRIPGAQLRLIDGARHGYFWEYREEASAAVMRFLA